MNKASVIIPSYNHAPYIRAAVASVLSQTWQNLELIIVDDGSDDSTLQVLSEISDPRMKVFVQENKGAHAAINKGMAAAEGEFLGILNSDDVYEADRLSTLIPLLEQNQDIGLIGSYLHVVNEEGKQVGIKEAYHSLEPWTLEHPERSFRSDVDPKAALLTENYLATTSNFLFRRSVYDRVGDFHPLRYAHDWDYALRIAQIADVHIVPKPLAGYRLHPTNTIRENPAAMIFEICWVLAMHLPGAMGQSWFGQESIPKRVNQLLHSIFTYGCNQVLIVMLIQALHDKQDIALHMLDPDNEARQEFLEYISENMQWA